jgi:hypothetical protein
MLHSWRCASLLRRSVIGASLLLTIAICAATAASFFRGVLGVRGFGYFTVQRGRVEVTICRNPDLVGWPSRTEILPQVKLSKREDFFGHGVQTIRTTPPLRSDNFYFPIATLLILPTVALSPIGMSAWKRKRRAALGQCLRCGYALSTLPQGAACPECGARSRQTSDVRHRESL